MPFQNWFNEIQRSFWHQLQVVLTWQLIKKKFHKEKKIVILNGLKECADEKICFIDLN